MSELAADLRRALEQDELMVLYQPIVDLVTLQIVGAEALLRWRHPTRGLLPPDAFIPAAETSGQIVPIGAWTLAEACRCGQAWRTGEHLDERAGPGPGGAAGPGPGEAARPLPGPLPGIAVNVSGWQLRHAGFVANVRAALESSGLDPRALLLELTETVLLKHRVVGTLERVRELGVGLAVDDFGTGHSSLDYLARFPLDALKLDKSYVDLLDAGSAGKGSVGRGAALVRGIVLLGHSLGLRTIAEGVASVEQLRLLRALGCQRGQGRLFDGPLDAAALQSRLGARLGPFPDLKDGPA
jgi:EAL domain-containing protein (putative c-di-GMP-specific phosphodiesterase class I)